MRILPLSFYSALSEAEIQLHECSDRIWVPRHMFERWLTAEEVGNVVIVQLEGIPACMYAPHTGPRNVLYAPTWMCEELGVSMDPPEEADSDLEDDYIVPERLQPPMCTFLKVQPHTSEHLPACVGGAGGDAMPEETLSRAFESYTCLREGQTLTLGLPSGDRLFATIVEALPHGQGPLCIRNTEIAMDLLEPLDRIVDTPEPVPTTTLTPALAPEQAPEPAPEQPAEPAYFQESREARRARCAAAALARFGTQTTTSDTC